MNIIKENIDDLNALLKVKVEKSDYAEKVESVLKDYRKKANIKGFRPGMVPIGLIRKMYGTAAKVDEINRLVSENIQQYLSDEKIDILGDPLPKVNDDERMNFELDEEFNFTFEIGLAPAFELKINKKNKVNKYKITIDDKMKSDYADNYARRFGTFVNEEIVEEKDVLKGDIASLGEDGNVAVDGLSAEQSTLSVDVIKDEDIKKSFLGKKVGDTIDFDLKKAFPSDYEVAGLLQKKREEVEKVEGKFRFTIKEVTRFKSAELNVELFDKIYGEGVVKTNEEFMAKVEEEISSSLNNESDYKLMLDTKDLTIKKTEFDLPEDFLKRWLQRTNENITDEQIEKEFDSFRNDLKWQLIRNKVAKENEIKITEEELLKEAESITRYQFQQYGLYYATDEQITNFAQETLKKEEEARRIGNTILDNKVLKVLEEMVKVEEKEITSEEFNKLFQ